MQHLKAAGLILLAQLSAAQLARADGCIDFKWDVRPERALFAQKPDQASAGTDLKSAPALTPGHLYRLKLSPQAGVKFEVTPAKAADAGADAFAGIAVLKIPKDGSYRVALEIPLWIDVVSNGALLEAKDYQGQPSCNAPHKIVVFELAHGKPLILQLSRASLDSVMLALTPVPDRVQ
jgi:hypothetical protein